MKREVFKENERVFFTCPSCGQKHNISAYGMWAYEKRKNKCTECEKTFQFYINQIGKVFTEEELSVKYLGYTYKAL